MKFDGSRCLQESLMHGNKPITGSWLALRKWRAAEEKRRAGKRGVSGKAGWGQGVAQLNEYISS